MSLFDPFNTGEIDALKKQSFNEEWGIWRRIDSLEKSAIPELHEKMNNPDWGIWARIDNLEKNVIPDIHAKFSHAEWGVWKRLVHQENENARLRKRVDKLEKLAANLEELFIKAVNKQLGEKK